MLDCANPPSNPKSPTYLSFGLYANDELLITVRLKDFAWLLGCNRTCTSTGEGGDSNEDSASGRTPIPVWSGYNSLLHQALPLARIGALPLVAAPAHEWSTMLTVLIQAQGITAQVMGPGHKTVISVDMGLYQPAKKLQMARNDKDHLILCPSELHLVMVEPEPWVPTLRAAVSIFAG